VKAYINYNLLQMNPTKKIEIALCFNVDRRSITHGICHIGTRQLIINDKAMIKQATAKGKNYIPQNTR